MQPTLLLVTSAHRGWRCLRPVLRKCPDIHLVGEVDDAAQAVSAATRLQPAAMLIGADIQDYSLVPLLQDLYAASPTSKIVVLGDEESLERSALLALGPLVTAYLVWSDLRAETVPRCLSSVIEDNVLVCSRAVLAVLLNPPGRRRWQRGHHVMPSERQRVILKGLAAGSEHEAIARAACCSERTMHREILALQEMLGASSQFELGMKAAQLGLVP